MAGGVSEQIEGQRQQGIACKNGGCFVKRLVNRGLPSAQVVIVHGWKVVMDQRIGMQTFQRAGGLHGLFFINVKQRCRLDNQKWPQPFHGL